MRGLQGRWARNDIGVGSRSPLVCVIAVVLAIAVLGPSPALAQQRPFRIHQYDLSPLAWAELSFHGWPAPETPTSPPRDADGVPMFRWVNDKVYYRPGEVAINGMRRLDTYVRTGDPTQLEQTLRNAAWLRREADRKRHATWLPFMFDCCGMKAPYYRAMTQGLVMSFFVRLHRIFGDERDLDFATDVFQSFMRMGTRRRPWVARVDDARHLWLEKAPGGIPVRILNGHLHATLGLFDYWQETGDPDARRLLLGAITTMRETLARFRVRGGLSRYCMACSYGIPKYHAIHIWQVRQLGRITGDRRFLAMADRFERDRTPRRVGNGAPGGPRGLSDDARAGPLVPDIPGRDDGPIDAGNDSSGRAVASSDPSPQVTPVGDE